MRVCMFRVILACLYAHMSIRRKSGNDKSEFVMKSYVYDNL